MAQASKADNLSAASEFLKAAFEFSPDHPVYLSSLPNLKDDPHEVAERRLLTRDPSAVDRFLARHNRSGRAVYYCVSTIEGIRRNKDAARELPGLFGDLDLVHIDADEATVREKLFALRCPPSALVRSGHGLHVYWWFKEGVDVTALRERLEAALRQLADLLAGDLAVAHVAALMRLPGSTNSKEPSRPKEVVCEFLDGPRYELDDLEEWLAETAPVLQRKGVSPLSVEGGSHPSLGDNPFLDAARLAAEAMGYKPPLDVEQALANMGFGNIHSTQLSVSASLLNTGHTVADTVAYLIDATRRAAGEVGSRWNWRREEKKLTGMCKSWEVKLAKEARQRPVRPHATAEAASSYKEMSPTSQTVNKPESAAETRVPNPAELAPVVNLATARAARISPPKGPQAKITHLDVGKVLLQTLADRGEALLFTDHGAWRYTDHLWRLENDRSMRDWLDGQIELCIRVVATKSTNRLVNETRGWVMRHPDLRKDEVFWDAHGQVPTRSGLVHPVTGAVTPPAPGHYATWRIDEEYDPAATCPHWLRMIDDVFQDRDEATRYELSDLLQEILGAGLLDVKPRGLSKALILRGGSNAGKSGLLEVMGGLFGEQVNTAGLDTLDGTHGLMPFMARLPWVLHEAFDQAKWHFSSMVKAVLTGEPVQINVKNGPMISRRVTVPALWGTNNPPQFKEATKAITNRIVVVECLHEFDEMAPSGVAAEAIAAGHHRPSALVLATERQGVLAWAVLGLRRALMRGWIRQPAELLATVAEIRRDSNLVLGFVEDCVEFDPNARIRTADFGAAFASWWLESKGDDRRIPSGDSIGRALRALSDRRIGIDRDRLRTHGRKYYVGMHLNEEGLRHWTNAVTADAFVFQGKKASTTASDADPNGTIPPDWDRVPTVVSMRAAHAKAGHPVGTRQGAQGCPE